MQVLVAQLLLTNLRAQMVASPQPESDNVYCAREDVHKCILIGAGAAEEILFSIIILMSLSSHQYNCAGK